MIKRRLGRKIEKAFVRAMNGIIDRKEYFLEKLSQDMCRGLESIKEECLMEELYTHLEELQENMKGMVKQSIKAGNVDENRHSVLGAEIEKVQNRMNKYSLIKLNIE